MLQAQDSDSQGILDSIHKIIDPFFKDQTTENKEEKKQSTDSLDFDAKIRQKHAARVIQSRWRIFKIFKEFLIDGYGTYLTLLGNQEIDEFAKLMYGRVISGFKTKKNEFLTGGNPNVHEDPYYNRSDHKFKTSSLVTDLIRDFGQEYDPTSVYVPYLNMHNFPIVEFIELLKKELKIGSESKVIEVLNYSEYDKLVFFKVDTEKNFETVKSLLNCAGAIASPLSLSIAKLALRKMKKRIEHLELKKEEKSNSTKIFNAPHSFAALLPIIEQLSPIINSTLSTRHLAEFLKNLLTSLGNYQFEIDKNIIQRIYFFLFSAIHFSKKSYERFGLLTYSIIHEFSLILYANQEKIEIEKYYQQFQESTLKDFSYFGLEEKKSSESASCQFLVAPTASGCNAFFIAIKLSQSLRSTEPEDEGKLQVLVKAPCYYETPFVFSHLGEKISIFNENIVEEKSPSSFKGMDIICISTGPICDPGIFYFGLDINIIIGKIIEQNKPLKKPVILLIDATSSLYRNLKISSEYHQYIESGFLSLIVFESLQKFGFAHSDYPQGGRAIVICSKKHERFRKDILERFTDSAKNDLISHFDMTLGAWFHIYCNLEILKEASFNNGPIYNEIISSSSKLTLSKQIITDEMKIGKQEPYFLLFGFHEYRDKFKLEAHFPTRDSFGHFVTSCCLMGISTYRISPNASDRIDSLIQSCALYFALAYTSIQLVDFLSFFFRNSNENSINLKDSVILLSVALAIANTEYLDLPSANYFYLNTTLLINTTLKFINPTLIGRYAYSKVYRYYKSHIKLIIDYRDPYLDSEIILQVLRNPKFLNFKKEILQLVELYCRVSLTFDKEEKLIMRKEAFNLIGFSLGRDKVFSANEHKIISTHQNQDSIYQLTIKLRKQNLLNNKFIDLLDKDSFSVAALILDQQGLLNKTVIQILLDGNVAVRTAVSEIGKHISLSQALIEKLNLKPVLLTHSNFLIRHIIYFHFLSNQELFQFFNKLPFGIIANVYYHLKNHIILRNILLEEKLSPDPVMAACSQYICSTFTSLFSPSQFALNRYKISSKLCSPLELVMLDEKITVEKIEAYLEQKPTVAKEKVMKESKENRTKVRTILEAFEEGRNCLLYVKRQTSSSSSASLLDSTSSLALSS